MSALIRVIASDGEANDADAQNIEKKRAHCKTAARQDHFGTPLRT